MENHWTVIWNPRACSGKGKYLWSRIESLLNESGLKYSALQTEHPWHAHDLALKAIEEGARRIIAVGGDGTVHEVANAILNQQVVKSDEVTLGHIRAGSGNDWATTLGIPKHPRKALNLILGGNTMIQDVARVYWNDDRSEKSRWFINMAGMGFDGFVSDIANGRKEQGRGGIAGYVGALLKGLKSYKPLRVSGAIDGHPFEMDQLFTLAVGICPTNGGGMRQCPAAVLDDSLLDLTLVDNLSSMKVIRNIPGLFSGKFVKLKEVHQFTGTEVIINGTPDLLLEADGEDLGGGKARFELYPKRLKVIKGAI